MSALLSCMPVAKEISVKFVFPATVLSFGFIASLSIVSGQGLPAIRSEGGTQQLIVQGKPFLILGGELGNSSAGTAAQADVILPKLARMHFNTVLMPVAWDQIEPKEGTFDFSIPDHWIDVARQQHLHLVFLWFGSWKNAFSEYAPKWVLSDTKRFPRAVSADGLPLEILSPLGEETVRSDSRAFAALMRHLRERDAEQQTVLMVQVENEVGYLGVGGRDRSDAANRLFQGQVPGDLRDYLKTHSPQISPKLAAHFNAMGRTWKEMFGEAADEVFMAWEYGSFVNQVTKAGKAEYSLPMYMNAQLPAEFEQAGEYPSGGPHPYFQAVYRAAAPSIDFYAPDIYWPNFGYWVDRYRMAGNSVFVPEARLDTAPWNALYTFGEARGFGFSPFDVDSISESGSRPTDVAGIADLYAKLSSLSGQTLQAQETGKIRGMVLLESSPRPSQTVSLGGFLFRAMLSRSWPAKQLLASDGGMMVVETAPNEFFVIGSGLTVTFLRDPDVDEQIAGIASSEQVSNTDGSWITERRLNGDQSDQGRELLMDSHEFRIYRVRLFTYTKH
jgi:beta-galactosidase GanA